MDIACLLGIKCPKTSLIIGFKLKEKIQIEATCVIFSQFIRQNS